MYISNVTASNLKGRSFAHDLTSCTLIIGPNYAGKTAITEAIRLSLLGYIPEIGKQNNASFELASGREMSVGVQFDLGAGMKKPTLSRRYWMDRNSVKSDFATQDMLGHADTESLATPLLDSAFYFSLTESQRINYIFERVIMPPAYTVDGIIAKLQQISFGKEHSEAMETAKADAIKDCRVQFEKEADTRKALSNLTDDLLKVGVAAHKRKAADSQGDVRMLTELKNREGECSAETLTDLRNEADRLNGLVAESNQELGRLNAQRQEAERVHARRVLLEAAVATDEPTWVPPVKKAVKEPVVEGWVELEAQLERVKEEISDIVPPDPELKTALVARREKFRESEANTRFCRNAVKEKEAAMLGVEKMDACPYCKSHADGWAGHVIDEMGAELATLNAKLISAVASESSIAAWAMEMEEAVGASEEKDTMLHGLTAQLDILQRRIEARKQEAEQATAQHQAALAKAESDYKAAVAALTAKKSAWTSQRKRDLDELARLEEVPAPTDEEVQCAAELAQQRMTELSAANSKIKTGEELAQGIRWAAQAAAQHELSKARADVLTRVRGTLQDIKGEMVAAAFQSLLHTANAIVGDLLLSPLAYDAENNEIGRVGPTGFIAHKSFSGSEKALTYVAIAAALSAKAPFKLLILDELARLTPSMQEATLKRLAECVESGIIDQVICVLPIDDSTPREFTEEDREKLIRDSRWSIAQECLARGVDVASRCRAYEDYVRGEPLSVFQRSPSIVPQPEGYSVLKLEAK